MPRKPSDGSDRQSINVRTRIDLKQRLERIAAENGRSLAQEVERRLEQSLEERPHQKMGDPLPGIFSDELRGYLRGQRDVARFLEALADVSKEVTRVCGELGRDEIEVRTALRAATDVVACCFLWRGEKSLPYPSGPQPFLGARRSDMPPAHIGYSIAIERLSWLGAFQGEGALVDTQEMRITNAFSGNGREIILGPTPEEAAARRAEQAAEARAAQAGGDMQADDPANRHKYKATDERAANDQEADPPAQSLKDIMGR